MKHQRFHYDTLADVRREAEAVSAWLPLAEDTKALSAPLTVAGKQIRNRIALQPMEGTDGEADGTPGELTHRRYRRFAEGGAGLIWFEAVAVHPEVRASAHQLMLTEKNLSSFQRIVDEIRESGMRKNGFAPMIIMQATHSGRYSKPRGVPEPLIAYNNPCLEDTPLGADRILSDDQIASYEPLFGDMARLAQKAGFDGMDVKCCHRYLASELLSAYTRPGKYGGSFENRTRFLLNAYRAAQAAITGDFFLSSRLNVYDGFPYPNGFGVTEQGGLTPVLDEAVALVGQLKEEMRIPMINVTIGNPYKNPHVNRPYDQGNYIPEEHPLTGVSRMMHCVSTIQKAHPELPVIGSAFSYLRAFSGNLAAGMIEGGHCQMAGFGRMAFAYPEFANALLSGEPLEKSKVCITCGLCAGLLRSGTPAGCVARDPMYRKGAKA